MVKFNSEIDNPNKQLQYSELLIEKYNAWYDDLSSVKVPDFLMDFYIDRLEFLEKQELACRIYIDTIEHNDINGLKDFDKLISEAQTIYIKSVKELDIIMENFNDEAEELGLTKPFPDIDSQ